jgi:hypothetical protein
MGNRKKFTAYITSCRRDISINSPKVLLLDIKDEDGVIFRDHCWVSECKLLRDIRPQNGRNRKVLIEFEATITTYYSGKNTLKEVNNLKRKSNYGIKNYTKSSKAALRQNYR